MMLSSGSRKNSVRWRQSGRSVGPRKIGTPLATSSAWQASTAGGGTPKRKLDRRRSGHDLPSSQTDHFPRGRSVKSAAPDAETDPVGTVGLDRKRHDVAVERARFIDFVAQQDGIIEVADFAEAHRDNFSMVQALQV